MGSQNAPKSKFSEVPSPTALVELQRSPEPYDGLAVPKTTPALSALRASFQGENGLDDEGADGQCPQNVWTRTAPVGGR